MTRVTQFSMMMLIIALSHSAIAGKVLLLGCDTHRDSLSTSSTDSMLWKRMLVDADWNSSELIFRKNLPVSINDFSLLLIDRSVALDSGSIQKIVNLNQAGTGVMVYGSDSDYTHTSVRKLVKQISGYSLILSQANNDSIAWLSFQHEQPGSRTLPPDYVMRIAVSNGMETITSSDTLPFGATIAQKQRTNTQAISQERGVVFLEKEKFGRFCWVAVRPSDVIRDYSIDKNNLNLFVELASWTSNRMTAAIQPWPVLYKNALVITAYLDGNSEEIKQSVTNLLAAKVPMSFAIREEALAQNSEAIQLILNAKMPLYGWMNEDVDDSSAHRLVTEAERVRRILVLLDQAGAKSNLLAISNARVDTVLLESCRLNLVASIETDRVTGSSFPISRKVSPKKNDYRVTELPVQINLNETKNELTGAELSELLLYQFENSKKNGSLLHIKLTPEQTKLPEITGVLENLRKQANNDEATWFSDNLVIGDWSVLRESLHLLYSYSADTLMLTVTNTGKSFIENARVTVSAPAGVAPDLVKIVSLNQNCTYDVDGNLFYINLPKLKPNDIFTAELKPDKKRLFHISLGTLPIIFYVGSFLIAVFLGICVYYFFFAKRERFTAASEKVTTEDQILNFGIYGQPEQMRSSVELNRPVEVVPEPIEVQPPLPDIEEDWTIRSSTQSHRHPGRTPKGGDRNNEWI